MRVGIGFLHLGGLMEEYSTGIVLTLLLLLFFPGVSV